MRAHSTRPYGPSLREPTPPPTSTAHHPRKNPARPADRAHNRHPATPQPRQKTCGSPTARTDGGRAYLVERGLEEDGYAALNALVADYLEQAGELDDVPMATSVLANYLRELAS